MAYCPHCGKETEKNEKFCTNCGKEIKSGGLQQKPEPGRGRGSISASVIITGMICVTVIIVVIAVALILAGRPSKQAEMGQGEPDSPVAEEKDLPAVAPEPEQKESAAPSAAPEPEQKESAAPSAAPKAEQGSQGNSDSGTEEDIPLKEWPERDTLPFSTENFYMELPGAWAEHYGLEKGDDFYEFYNVENAAAGYGGFLFSIEIYKQDGEWEYLPSYQFLGEKDGVYYVASFPTDVQFDMENQENQEIYKKMQEDVEGILGTFTLK